MNAPNGPFSQPESTTGARRDCDARNCCDARTVSDARGSSGARTALTPLEIPLTHPRFAFARPVVALRADHRSQVLCSWDI